MTESRATYTLDQHGKATHETRDGITMPLDYSFAGINDFVHNPDVHFETLQALALGMAVQIDKLTIISDEWKSFNYEDYETGLFWLLVEAPDVDIDADDEGRTVGRYTGGVVRKTVLAMVEEDHDGLPYFDAVDPGNYGQIPDDGVVTHYAEVKAPVFGGDIAAVDEFLQLYCLDQHRPSQPEAQEPQP